MDWSTSSWPACGPPHQPRALHASFTQGYPRRRRWRSDRSKVYLTIERWWSGFDRSERNTGCLFALRSAAARQVLQDCEGRTTSRCCAALRCAALSCVCVSATSWRQRQYSLVYMHLVRLLYFRPCVLARGILGMLLCVSSSRFGHCRKKTLDQFTPFSHHSGGLPVAPSSWCCARRSHRTA